MNTLYLKPGKEHSVERFHPWIFSGAVQDISGETRTGETIRIADSKGNFLAYGAYAPDSRIRARVWSFSESETIDRDFFARRIESAYNLRKAVFGGTLPDACRLIFAESDSLPGITVDLYKTYAVCQLTGAGAEYWRSTIAELLLKYAPDGVYERSDADVRLKEGLTPRTGLILGSEPPEKIEFTENGVKYQADVRTGHKTGFYLDQRYSRLAVAQAAAGAESVLNCFCYTGGFGLAALHGGAKQVLNVDTSGPALAQARIHAELNGFPETAFQTLEADVFQFLRTCRDSRKSFDLIILDPPKFAESAAMKEKAARGYKDINLLAMKLLRPGGKLFTFSCSGAMDDALFGKVVDSAAADAKIDFRIVHWLSQGPDHPVSSAFPEGRYLKGLAGFRMN